MPKRKAEVKKVDPTIDLPMAYGDYFKRIALSDRKRREYLFWWRKTLTDLYICDGDFRRRFF